MEKNGKNNDGVSQNTVAQGTTDEKDPMQRLEDALVLCKFGRFHLKLLLATLTCTFACTMVTTTSSYILPSAECDLNMDIMQKGLLNAMPFFGQVGCSLFSGFITDTFGRRNVLFSGNVGIFIFTILEGSSQTYWMLLVIKLIEGIFLSLCFGAVTTVVPEFTHKNVRDRVILTTASFMSTSLIVAALMSWILLPQPWYFVIVEGYFELHSWNIYLYICSLWSLVAAIMYYILPESPKYLLSHGQSNEALEVLKRIYSENTGNPRETFPVTSLHGSDTYISTKETSIKKQIVSSLFDVKELFQRPLFCRLVLFSSLTFVCLLAYTALRLWFPQLSTIIENYQRDNGETAQFCVMISNYTRGLVDTPTLVENVTEAAVCVPKLSGSETYINGIILGVTSLLCMIISTFLVAYCGQKPLMFVLMILCAVCSGALYWTNSSIQIAILISATCGFMQTSLSLQHNILIRVFPTTIRTVALSLILMMGRIASLSGSVLFPVMLRSGCMTPFLTLSVITLCVAGLVYFLPNPRKENKITGDR